MQFHRGGPCLNAIHFSFYHEGRGTKFPCRCKVPKLTFLCYHQETQDSVLHQTCPPTVPVIRIPIYSASPKGQTDFSDPLLLPTLSRQMLLKRSWPRASAGLPIGLDIAVLCFCFQGSVASDLTARLEYSSSSSGLLFINCRWPHPVS